MSSSGSSRVSIPNNIRKTIQNIKEITSNHSEEDIYAMLKECSMDPNETTQRLLHLDTFHEVKRKRAKRKEHVKSKPAEEYSGKPGYQGRGTRGTRDTGGWSNAAIRKENGVVEGREKGFRRLPIPASMEMDPVQPLHVEKLLSVALNGPVKVLNGSPSTGYSAQSSGVSDTYLSKENADVHANNLSIMPKGSAGDALFASDTILVPSCDSHTPVAVGAIKREVHIQRLSAEPSQSMHTDKGVGTFESVSSSCFNKHEPQSVDEPEVPSPTIEKDAFEPVNVAQPKILGQCPAAEIIHPPDDISVVKSLQPQGVCLNEGVEETSSKIKELKFSDGKHVIIPNHIQVPDAVKNVLSFGSLDATFGVRKNYVNSDSNKNSDPAADSALVETARKPSSCDQDAVQTIPEGKLVDQPQSLSHLPGENLHLEPKVFSSSTVPKDDQLKEETLAAVGPPFPVVQTTPSYSFGFMPTMLVNSQGHVSSSLTGSSAMSTSSSTLPPAQSAGAGQSSVAMSPQHIALFRQPYPPNYVPYSHYFSPFLVPPTMHQYFGHTAFPPPLPPGSLYLPPPAGASGMKISPAPYKSGTNVGNQTPVGVQSGYGTYSSSQVGFSVNASVTSGNSSTSEDLMPSGLKENNIYSGQQSEGSTVWVPAVGRDTASFPLNSFLNLPPQGHVMTPQSGPGAFVYHTLQPVATPAPSVTVLQQSQPVAGSESVGPASNAYQLPQRQQQLNWKM